MFFKSGMSAKPKVFRVVTIPAYTNLILRNQLGYLQQFFTIIGVTANDNFHYNFIAEREGIKIYAIDIQRKVSVYNDVKSLLSLIVLLVKEQPQVIHTQTPKAGLIGMIAGAVCRVPVRICSVTGIPLRGLQTGRKGWFLGVLEWVTFRLATCVVPNSLGIEQQLTCSMDAVERRKMLFLGNGSTNGVDLQRFSQDLEQREVMRSQWNIGKDRLVLGYVGRIARDKGSRELLDAFKRLKPKYPQLVLLMVGLPETEYGELGVGFEEELKQTEGVVLAGRPQEVVPYFQMMDILVHPTYREGLPNALLEASAMELPIVSTDIPGCNEVVAHGVTGLLVAPKDVDALEVAIEELLVDAGKRTLFGKAGRVRVSERYEQRKVWDYWKQLYEQSLDTVR